MPMYRMVVTMPDEYVTVEADSVVEAEEIAVSIVRMDPRDCKLDARLAEDQSNLDGEDFSPDGTSQEW